MVIASRNPVQSVLFLILAFVNAAGLFLIMGAEFLAMILVIVYVGAVAVLFLFVVMMLDVDFAELRQGFLQYLPFGALIGVLFFLELTLVIGAYIIVFGPCPLAFGPDFVAGRDDEHRGVGREVLYTRYFYFFQAAGLILLVAMIGAIVLTLRERKGIRRQNISVQNARTQQDVELRKVPSRQGI